MVSWLPTSFWEAEIIWETGVDTTVVFSLKGYGKKTTPLLDLLKKNHRWEWLADCQQAEKSRWEWLDLLKSLLAVN